MEIVPLSLMFQHLNSSFQTILLLYKSLEDLSKSQRLIANADSLWNSSVPFHY